MDKINFEKFEVNEETREITFSCASSLPYQRYDSENDIVYNEILVIDENAVDLSRLNNSAPLLFNHDTDKLLGCVQKAWIVEDRVFVRVRFSKNDQFADRIFRDMIDGLIKNISIGYMVLQYEDKKENGVNNRYVTKWMIYETSVVSIPADPQVGLRQLEIKEIQTMQENTNETQLIEQQTEETEVEAEAVEETNTEDVDLKKIAEQIIDQQAEEIKSLKAENEALKQQLEETENEETEMEESVKAEIQKIGADFEIPQQEIKSAVEQKLSVKEFKNKIKNFNVINKESKKMNKREFANFLSARDFDKPFVMRDFTGFADAALVGTETTPLVAALERKLGVKGFKTISGLTSNISIPVQANRITVGEVGINDASAESKPVFESVELTPKKITGSVLIGKEMLANSNSDVEAFVIDSLLKEIAYKTQALMLQKIAESAGKEITYSAVNAITWQDILAMEAAVDSYMVDGMAFVMSPAARAALKGIAKGDNTAARFICEDNLINGYEVNVSGCVDNDNIYFGGFGELVLANWGDVEILVDPYTEGRSGAVWVTATALLNAAVTQKHAFAVGKIQG